MSVLLHQKKLRSIFYFFLTQFRRPVWGVGENMLKLCIEKLTLYFAAHNEYSEQFQRIVQ